MPILKRLTPMILASVAISLAAAGCGGGDDPEPAPAPVEQPAETAALTKEQLISQGDGICAEVNAAVGTIESSTTIADSDKAGQVADLYDGLADRLEDLGKPSDGEAPTEVIAALRGEQGSTATEDAADPAAGMDLTAFQDAATAYGFSDCAEAPAAPAPPSTGSDSSIGTEGTDSTGDEGTYTEPAPAEPTPAPAPPADTGGVNPDAGGTGGGTGGGSGGSSGGSGGSSGGIGPG